MKKVIGALVLFGCLWNAGASLIVSNGTFTASPDNRNIADHNPLVNNTMQSGVWFISSTGVDGWEYDSGNGWVWSEEGQRRTMVQFIDITAGTDAGAYTLQFDWRHELATANNGIVQFSIFTSDLNTPTNNWDLSNGTMAGYEGATWSNITGIAQVSTNATTSFATASTNFTIGASTEWVAVAILADNSGDNNGKVFVDNVTIIPEPGVASLIGMAGIVLVGLRRIFPA